MARVSPAFPSEDIGGLLDAYLRDPIATGGPLIASLDSDDPGLPAPLQLALADAYLRRGETGRARRLLLPLADATVPTPWSGFAQLGLGMIQARRGELAEARQRFASAARTPGAIGRAALLAGSYAALGMGDQAAARASLERLSGRMSGAPAGVRWAADFAQARVVLAEGRASEAAAAFAALRTRAARSDQAADAGYAAALAWERAGDPAAARGALDAVVGACPARPADEAARRTPTALRRLDPRAVLRTWLDNYQETAFVGAESGTVFGLRGCDLAADALDALLVDAGPGSHELLIGEEGTLEVDPVSEEGAAPAAPIDHLQPSRAEPGTRTPLDPSWRALGTIGAAALLVAVGLWRARRRS